MKHKIPLDMYEYDLMPAAQKVYLARYGWHFSKHAYMIAAKQMRKLNKSTGKEEKVPIYTKEEVDALLQKHNITVENKGGYDYVYAAQMCRADNLGGSVPDEAHLAQNVRETCDDIDAGDGTVMRQWLVKMVANGEPVDWEELLEEE